MGYYIQTHFSSFYIRKQNLDGFFNLAKSVFEQSALDRIAYRSYSWVDHHAALQAIEEKNLEKLFECFRYRAIHMTIDDKNDLFACTQLYTLQHEQKMGDERVLFAAIAPVVENESYIAFSGEDGYFWRFVWRDGRLYEEESSLCPIGSPEEITVDKAIRMV